MYSIKINKTGRYIKWCDDKWYETIPDRGFLFTYGEVKGMLSNLKLHYIYSVDVTNENDGSIEHHNLITGKVITENKQEVNKPKKCITKLKLVNIKF